MQSEGLNEIKQKISAQKDYLRKTYGVEKIGIFGSFARNEATVESDLDVVVSLKEPISYFKFFNLENQREYNERPRIGLMPETSPQI